MVNCKITVLRRIINEDFAKEYTKEKIELCPKNSEGLVYISIDGANLIIFAIMRGEISKNMFLLYYLKDILESG